MHLPLRERYRSRAATTRGLGNATWSLSNCATSALNIWFSIGPEDSQTLAPEITPQRTTPTLCKRSANEHRYDEKTTGEREKLREAGRQERMSKVFTSNKHHLTHPPSYTTQTLPPSNKHTLPHTLANLLHPPPPYKTSKQLSSPSSF